MTHQPTTAKSHKVLSLTKSRNSVKSAKPRNRTMFQPSFILWTCLCVSLVFICDGLSVAHLNLLENGKFHVMTKRVCSKSIGECLTDPEMDSESNRRVLAMQRRYISYDTLRRDMVPCDRAGASYYNCRATRANAYNRGCEVITGCARGIKGNSEETAHNTCNPNEDISNTANTNEEKNILEEVAVQTRRSNRLRRTTWKMQEMEKHKKERKGTEKESEI